MFLVLKKQLWFFSLLREAPLPEAAVNIDNYIVPRADVKQKIIERRRDGADETSSTRMVSSESC